MKINLSRVLETGKDSRKVRNFSKWIIVLMGFLIGLNALFFTTYDESHPKQEFWLQLWTYFDSNTFRALMVSLAFPVIILIIESHFKIVEHIFQNRLEREKREFEEQVEKRRKLEEERKEKRLEAIRMTSESFKQVNGLVSEVRVYDDKGQLGINEIIGRIASQSIALSELINTWIVRFPILPTNVHSLFRGYVVILYWGAWAIAHCIHNNIGGDKKDLQESLAMIQRGIVSIAFHPIFNTLTISMNLMESLEELYKNVEDYRYDDKGIIKTNVKETETRYGDIIDIIKTNIENSLNDSFFQYNSLCESMIVRDSDHIHKSVQDIPLNAIWLTYKENIKDKVTSKLDMEITDICSRNPKIEEKAQKKIKAGASELLLDIIQLKVYAVILNLQEFVDEEFLPSENTSTDLHSTQEEKIRHAYQSIKKYMANLKKFETSDEYKKFFSSQEYQEFKLLYFGMKDTDMINMVATDTLQRIKKMGTLIRFGYVLPFGSQGKSAVK